MCGKNKQDVSANLKKIIASQQPSKPEEPKTLKGVTRELMINGKRRQVKGMEYV
jgi:hypothetical protein